MNSKPFNRTTNSKRSHLHMYLVLNLNFRNLTNRTLLIQLEKRCLTTHLFQIPTLPQVNVNHGIVSEHLAYHLFFELNNKRLYDGHA